MAVKTTSDVLEQIRYIMFKNKISITDLAIKLHMTRTALSNRLNRDNISLNSLLEICDALDADLDITITPRER